MSLPASSGFSRQQLHGSCALSMLLGTRSVPARVSLQGLTQHFIHLREMSASQQQNIHPSVHRKYCGFRWGKEQMQQGRNEPFPNIS